MTISQVRPISLRDVPARSQAATQVMLILDDPDTNVADVASVLGSDPAFASKTIALANSAYYGLSGRVGTLNYAISVLGFQTVRALAVSIAAGLEGPDAVPAGYWHSAATAATSAALIAPLLAANPPDAFCAGLLHTLGTALLHHHAPGAVVCLPFAEDPDEALSAERAAYGLDHAELGAEVLASWRFPSRLCTLIAGHHEVAGPESDALTRTLQVARLLTDLALREDADPAGAGTAVARLTGGVVIGADLEGLVGRVREQAQALAEGLTSL